MGGATQSTCVLPPFELTTLQYRLKLKVSFPGMFPGSDNEVELEMPVTIVSGVDKSIPGKRIPSTSDLYHSTESGLRNSCHEIDLPR